MISHTLQFELAFTTSPKLTIHYLGWRIILCPDNRIAITDGRDWFESGRVFSDERCAVKFAKRKVNRLRMLQ